MQAHPCQMRELEGARQRGDRDFWQYTLKPSLASRAFPPFGPMMWQMFRHRCTQLSLLLLLLLEAYHHCCRPRSLANWFMAVHIEATPSQKYLSSHSPMRLRMFSCRYTHFGPLLLLMEACCCRCRPRSSSTAHCRHRRQQHWRLMLCSSQQLC